VRGNLLGKQPEIIITSASKHMKHSNTVIPRLDLPIISGNRIHPSTGSWWQLSWWSVNT